MAPRLGVTLISVPIAGAAELHAGFATIEREQAQALIVQGGHPILQENRLEMANFAIRHGLPSVTGLKVLVPDGLLMSYAHDPATAFRRGGWYDGQNSQGSGRRRPTVDPSGIRALCR